MIRTIITILILLSGLSGKVSAFSESCGKTVEEKIAEKKFSVTEKRSPGFQNDSADLRAPQIPSQKDSLLLIGTSAIRKEFPDTASRLSLLNSSPAAEKPATCYTIQICSMSFPLSDSFFKGQYGVKVMRMGDLYRYIYSVYDSLEAARKDLPKVRKIYPDAFIREFDENKLGKAVDLNIENLK